MVLGDSWAFFSWSYNSYNENLDRFGFTDVRANSNINISVNGSRASDYFSETGRKQAVADFLAANPEVTFCHLSLGGNDVLGEWNVAMTDMQEDSLLDVILRDLRRDIDTLLSLKPSLTFLISGYDYPNFVETAALSPSHPFFEQWTEMGQPDALQINTMLGKLTQRFADSAAVWSDVAFVNNNGLMQWHYGQNSPLLIPPYSTYPPHSVPLPGGNPNFPSPRSAMQVGGIDSFHLCDEAYEIFIQRHFWEYYWQILRPADTSYFATDTLLNGSVTAASQAPGWVCTGRQGNDESLGILTFQTQNPGVTSGVSRASLFVNRQQLAGGDLAGQELTLEVKAGYFGSGPGIDSADYAAPADATAIACTFGTVEDNDYWMRIDLPPALLPFINKEGITQFRMKYTSAVTGQNITFKNGADPLWQPILDVTYGAPAAIPDQPGNSGPIIFPNPADQMINIQLPQSTCYDLSLMDLTGRILTGIQYGLSGKITICSSSLQNGIYFLVLQGTGNRYTIPVVVQH